MWCIGVVCAGVEEGECISSPAQFDMDAKHLLSEPAYSAVHINYDRWKESETTRERGHFGRKWSFLNHGGEILVGHTYATSRKCVLREIRAYTPFLHRPPAGITDVEAEIHLEHECLSGAFAEGLVQSMHEMLASVRTSMISNITAATDDVGYARSVLAHCTADSAKCHGAGACNEFQRSTLKRSLERVTAQVAEIETLAEKAAKMCQKLGIFLAISNEDCAAASNAFAAAQGGPQEMCEDIFSLPSLRPWPYDTSAGEIPVRFEALETYVSLLEAKYTDAKSKLLIEKSYVKEVNIQKLVLAFHVTLKNLLSQLLDPDDDASSLPDLQMEDMHSLGLLPSDDLLFGSFEHLPSAVSSVALLRRLVLKGDSVNVRGYLGTEIGGNCSTTTLWLLARPVKANQPHLDALSKVALPKPDGLLPPTLVPSKSVFDISVDSTILARPKWSLEEEQIRQRIFVPILALVTFGSPVIGFLGTKLGHPHGVYFSCLWAALAFLTGVYFFSRHLFPWGYVTSLGPIDMSQEVFKALPEWLLWVHGVVWVLLAGAVAALGLRIHEGMRLLCLTTAGFIFSPCTLVVWGLLTGSVLLEGGGNDGLMVSGWLLHLATALLYLTFNVLFPTITWWFGFHSRFAAAGVWVQKCSISFSACLFFSVALIHTSEYLLPMLTMFGGGANCVDGIDWEVHLIFALMQSVKMLLFWANEVGHKRGDTMTLWSHFVPAFFTLLGSLDIYTDLVFVAIAQSCGGWIGDYALRVFLWGVVFAQFVVGGMVALAVSPYHFLNHLYGTPFKLVPQKETFFSPEPRFLGVAVAHMVLTVLRVVAEDIPQLYLQVRFTMTIKRNPLILASIAISIGSMTGSLGSACKDYFCTEASLLPAGTLCLEEGECMASVTCPEKSEEDSE